MSVATASLTPQEAADKIQNAGSQFFTVTFVKRTDNTLRVMNCRRGVKAGVKGTSKRRKKPVGLVTVYDMKSHGYRRITHT